MYGLIYAVAQLVCMSSQVAMLSPLWCWRLFNILTCYTIRCCFTDLYLLIFTYSYRKTLCSVLVANISGYNNYIQSFMLFKLHTRIILKKIYRKSTKDLKKLPEICTVNARQKTPRSNRESILMKQREMYNRAQTVNYSSVQAIACINGSN